MRILGIETSCDDTSIGIVNYARKKFTIEAQVTASQILIHRKYGGVVPEVAAREHALTIWPTLEGALATAKKTWADIDAVAVTAGPGLNTALLVGVETARTLSYVLKKPLLRINHIEGHICSAWAAPEASKINFPAVALVVSGGHTELIKVSKFGTYSLIGKTRDDAVGEAFDKTAKILGLPYPGGPEISKAALSGNDRTYNFPRAMMQTGNFEFSYAGLKTSVLYTVKEHRRLTKKQVADICASFQTAALEPLVKKTAWAVRKVGAKSVVLGGGVAANKQLRSMLQTMVAHDLPGVDYIEPALSLCMDNGVMIAIAGVFRAKRKDFIHWQKIQADPNWELV